MTKLPLGPGTGDHIAAVVRGVIGATPFVGPALNELVTHFIPGVRLQRIEDYLLHLGQRLEGMTEEQARQRLLNEEAADLVEEGAYQAVRALSDARRQQIAAAVATGLSGEQRNVLQAKRMLSLLRELDDGQIIVLTSKLMKYSRDNTFRDRHKEILTPVLPHLQSDRETLDAATVQRIAVEKLTSLGLISPSFKKFKKGDVPEFDPKTGMIAASGTGITQLGRLLLRTIGLATADDY